MRAAAVVDRARPRPSMRRRVWLVTVVMQLLGVAAVGSLCFYEGCESVTAAYRGQTRAIIKGMGEALEAHDDLQEARADLDAFCGGLRTEGRLVYCIWRVEDQTVLLDSARPWMDLSALRRERISRESADDNHQSLWLLGEPRSYFARWRLHEGRWGRVIILAAVDISDQLEELNEFLMIVLLGSLAVLAACALLTRWLVGLLTRPLVEISERLSATPLHALASLELKPDAPAELAPFVEVVQDVIRRLDEHRRREKRFIADVSHDLKTPAALIKSSAELALSRRDDPAAWRASLAEILGDVDRMDAMLSQLMELARLDATLRLGDGEAVDLELLRREVDGDCRDLLEGRPPLVWRVAGVGGVAGAAGVAGVAGVAGAAGISGIKCVWGNAGMLRRMLVNLARNALHYGPPDGRVTISFEASDGAVLLRVHDEGGGLSRREIELITQRFTRLDASRRGRADGCGLGLSIVAEIVRLHQGELAISSSPTEGTTVTVTLPIRAPSDNE